MHNDEQRGRPAALLGLPPDDAWPPPDTFINRQQLAELYGVTVEVVRGWQRRGRGPPRIAAGKRGDFTAALYSVDKAKAWLIDAVAEQAAAKQDTAAAKSQPPLLPVVEYAAAPPTEPIDTSLLVQESWNELDDADEPFPSNERRQSSSGRYWS